MRTVLQRHALSVLGILLTAAGAASPATNLARNGSFDSGIEGWGHGAARGQGVSITSAESNAWLVLDGPASVSQRLPIDPDWLALRVTARMRTTGVVVGQEGWQDARLAMDFKDASGKHLSPWPNVFHATGTTAWAKHERTYKIPPGATCLDLNPAMFGSAGKVEFDDIAVTVAHAKGQPIPDLPLPDGAPDTDDLSRAWRRSSSSREEICLNGLWRFLPAAPDRAASQPGPGSGWGWFKVPGIWPASEDSAQQVLLPENLDGDSSHAFEQAWYRRELPVPTNWNGRRILVDFRMIQTHARVWIDSAPAGEIFFPGGRLDITAHVRPGTRHTLTILLTAKPLEPESNVFMAPERIITSKAAVKLKGITGDVLLVSEPSAATITDAQVRASVRDGSITFDAGIANARPMKCVLAAQILDAGKPVKALEGAPFDTAALKNGRVSLSAAWPGAKRWDTDSPHLYDAIVTLKDAAGNTLDQTLPVRFGFREFSIEGRDFLLNGTRIHLRALHSSNINGGADIASIEGCRNTCRRLAQHGFNFLITGNYNFSPGEVSYMDALFDACDETGILAAFSLPHVKDFAWKMETPEQAARYRALCEWLIRRAQNHPSIILYSMNHNATGYYGDQNPLRMDGIYEPNFPPKPSPDPKAPPKPDSRARNRAQAQLAADIAKSLDPTRPVYHHQSGNLGDLYTVNIYLNWAPLQERSDWLEHWATHGKKPMFFVEWGLPHISSWSSFRGPAFIWRNPALQQIWDSEFAAAYLGDRAYEMTETKIASMKWEEELWAKGESFYWSSLIRHLKTQDENYTEIQALFAADNWRSHRAWGISAMLPWDQENLWRKTPSFPSSPAPAPERWQNLQSPGIVPDQIPPPSQYIYCRDDRAMRPSALGNAFLEYNMPLCAFIGGGPNRSTEKSHVFRAGEMAHKQLVMINDSRRETTCKYRWGFHRKKDPNGAGTVTLAPGGKTVIPISFDPSQAPEGPSRVLTAQFAFGEEPWSMSRCFFFDVLPAPSVERFNSRIALFDPKGLTAPRLKDLGATFSPVAASDNLATCDLLVIGRQALAVDGPAPDISRVADGLRVLVLEQDAEVLERRFGFRINIHGLRRTFPRHSTHPALAGITGDPLHDWRGAATLVPPHLGISGLETSDPKWLWCGFENTRVWRCGNHGSVATVLIEKPERGDWLPIVDGGFDLQYAPLLECTHGKGRIIFCQLDVTARTEDEPAAQAVFANLIRYLDTARPATSRPVLYSGNEEGLGLLRRLGHAPSTPDAKGPPIDALLILGPGHQTQRLDSAVAAGADVLGLGLSPADLQRAFAERIETTEQPTISGPLSCPTPPEFNGISSADLHWRTAPTIAALSTNASPHPALAVLRRGKGRIVLCQAAPWMFDCQKHPYLRTTHRRTTFLVSRLLANLGARADCPIIDRFAKRPDTDRPWLGALYLQDPVAEDDPYRYYRW